MLRYFISKRKLRGDLYEVGLENKSSDGCRFGLGGAGTPAVLAQDKPNVVILMTDDTGWNDFGAYGGGANLGHPTPKIL
jgi:hypothetical protein